jgi:acetyl esterase/lipase
MAAFCKTLLMAMTTFGMASGLRAEPQTLPLWPEGVPNAKGSADADVPNITVYLPPASKAACGAVLICPGGGYNVLCSSYEGHDIAKWLNGYGIAGIVLKYRLNPYRHPVPLQDAQRAMRLVRLYAKDWHIAPNRIGVMGFSAGGHLASTLGTHFDAGNPEADRPIDRMSCRPDFMILVYPVITMGSMGHGGSKQNLLGPMPSQADIELLSNERHVTEQTPPAFLAHSIADRTVSVENSRMFYKALKAKGVPAKYVELKTGDHGLGCGKGAEWEQWQSACAKWLKSTVLK